MRELARNTVTVILALLGLLGLITGIFLDVVAMNQIDSGIEDWVRAAPVQIVFGSALMISGAILLGATAIRAAIRHRRDDEQVDDY